MSPTPVILVSPRALPEEPRSWLDPARPLPADVTLVGRVYPINVVLAVTLGIPFVLGVCLALADLVQDRWKGENTWLLPIFTVPFLLHGSLILWQRRMNAELRAGRKRLGLFLSPSALLIHETPTRCSWIPRASLVRFDLKGKYIGGQIRAYELHVHYRGDGGSLEAIVLTPSDFTPSEHCGKDLLQRLERWRTDGEPAAAPAERKTPMERLSRAMTNIGGVEVATTWTLTRPEDTAEVTLLLEKVELAVGKNRTEAEWSSHPFEAFLRGEGQSEVLIQLGPEVLAEVVASVRAYLDEKASQPGHRRRRSR